MQSDNLLLEITDGERISLFQDNELYEWSEKLNVSPVELRDAVNQVGNLASDVAHYLKMGINK